MKSYRLPKYIPGLQVKMVKRDKKIKEEAERQMGWKRPEGLFPESDDNNI
jgi:hypothetical protein